MEDCRDELTDVEERTMLMAEDVTVRDDDTELFGTDE